MPCQTQTNQTPQQPSTVLPQNLPQTQADWSRFLQRMNEVLASISNAQYATGINAVPTQYAVYDGTGLPALRITGATSAFDTAHAQFGAGSLKLTATASTVTVELAASGYPVTLHPNWQWIASLFILTSAAGIAGKLSVVTPVKQYDVDISGTPGASWARLYGDYTLTADASTSCTLLLTLTGASVGQTFNLEGWMLEPSQGAVLPSPFIMTSGPRTWAQVVNDGTKPDNNANYVAGVVNSYITGLSFAAGLGPVNIVTALPTLPSSNYPDGSLVVLTIDHKLYRNSTGAWTKAVDGADILANSITAGSISVGAINASAIAAGAVTANAIAAGAVQASAISVTSLSAISANLGTVTAGTLQDSAGKFVINLAGQTQTIKDGANTTRVLIGNLGTDYGIQVFGASGAKIFDASSGAWDATNNQPVVTTAANAQTTANNATSAASTAQSTANQANTTAQNLNIVNLSMAQGMLGWTCAPTSEAANWYGETGANGPNGGTSTYIVHRVSGTTSTLDNTLMPCYSGQVIKASGQCRGVGTPNGSAAMFIAFYDINKSLIGSPANSNVVSGNGQFQLYVVATAPANAAFVTIGPSGGYAPSSPAGYYTFANFAWNYQPNSVDEVPDGSTYAKVRSGQLTNGVVSLLGTGRNSVPNPTFSANTAGTASGWGVNQQFRDGWSVSSVYAGMTVAWDANVGPAMYTAWNQSIPPNAQVSSQFNSTKFAVAANHVFAIRTNRTGYVEGAGTITAGVELLNSVGVSWYDNAGNYISTSWFEKNGVYSNAYDTVTGTVPSNAVNGFISLVGGARNTNAYSTTPGNTLESGWTSVQYVEQTDLDNEVADGSTYLRMPGANMDANRRGLIDFTQGGHLNKNLDNLADGTTYGRPWLSRLNGGRPWIDFSESIHSNKKLDYLADSASYAKAPAMGGSAIVVPNANFLAPIDGAGNIPGWKSENGATLAYYTTSASPFTNVQCLHATLSGSSPSGFGARGMSFKADGGDTFYVKGWAYSDTGALAQIMVFFYSSALAYLGQVTAACTSYGAWQQISASGSAPSGTAQAILFLFNSDTNGGSSYFYGIGVSRAQSIDNEVVDGSIYLRMPGANMDANRRGLVDFSQGGHLNKNLDNLADGATYGRIYGTELSAGKHRLGVANSGYRVGNQANLPQRTITNYPSKVAPTVSYSASAGTPATATISVAAFTALLGSVSVAYNAASASVTGTGGTNVNYYLYFNDPTYSGGTQTLVPTTNQNDLYSGDGYVYVGYVTVAFPSSGSGGGGGTGCPLRTSWVIRRGRQGRPQHVRAGKVRVGDWLLRTDGEWAEVTFSRAELQPCVRLVANGFGTLGCSASAPMQLRESVALSVDCLAREVVVRRGSELGCAIVTDLHDLGDQWVQHITLANAPDDFFWTGDAKGALFGHHNAKPP